MRLLPGENVVWATRKAVLTLSFGYALFVILGGFFLAGYGFVGGEINGLFFAPVPHLGWVGVGLFLVGLVYVTVSIVVAKSTEYILTNQRIVQARFGKVAKQISILNFMGSPPGQFLDKVASGSQNDQPIFDVRITDPKSVDFMEIKSLTQKAVEELERICERARQVVLCTYCKTKNSANCSVCSNCGATFQ